MCANKEPFYSILPAFSPITMSIFKVVEDKIFTKRVVLSTKYTPDHLIGRDKEIRQIASLFAPALNGDEPDNAFIYGKTGVGKTATTKYVLLELDQEVKEVESPVKSVFVNCNQINTTTKILKRICNVIAPEVEVPGTGLATSEYYRRLWDVLNEFKGITIIVLDEVDKLEDDNLLYNLPRARENLDITDGFVSILGISNDLTYKERLDARTLSSFGDKEFVFSPYDAIQLREILEERATAGFKEDVLSDDVIPLCAALAAQEHGDARKALMLLRYAGEVAVERGSDHVVENDVREAQNRLESDKIVETVKTLPYHQKLVLYIITSSGAKEIGTNEIYTHYKTMCDAEGQKPLSKVRVSAFISELDMLGLISAKQQYKGRYGRIRLVASNISKEKVQGLLHES
ncbi:MAG: Cdc6/Cdc18 family protein [Halobacteriota archaeon]